MRTIMLKSARLLLPLTWLVAALYVQPCLAESDSTAQATKAAATVPAETLSPEVIEARIKQVEASTAMGEAVKQQVLENYKAALEQLQAAQRWSAKAADYEKDLKGAPSRLEAIKAELAQPAVEIQLDVSADTTLDQLQAMLSKAEAQLEAAQSAAAKLKTIAAGRTSRRAELARLMAAAQQRLLELTDQLQGQWPPDEPPQVAESRRARLRAGVMAVEKEISAYESELASYEAGAELLQARQDLAVRQVGQLQRRVEQLRRIVHQRRQQQAQQLQAQAREAQRRTELSRAHPAIRQLAQENLALAELLTGEDGLVARIAEASQRVQRTRETLDQVRRRYQSVRDRLNAVGMTKAMGVLLRKERSQLPDIDRRRREIRRLQSRIADAHLTLMDLREQRAALSDIDSRVRETVEQLERPPQLREREELEKLARQLLQTRRDYLDELLKQYEIYFAKLVDLEQLETDVLTVAREFSGYIDEHVLWFRSSPALGYSDLPRATEALRWLLSPSHWLGVAAVLWRDAGGNPAVCIFFVLTFAAMVLGRRRLVDALKGTGGLAKSQTKPWDAYLYTLEALALTGLLSVIWPALLAFISWRLASVASAPPFAEAAAGALQDAAVVLLTLQILRTACVKHGLGQSHFRWREQALSCVHRNVSELAPILLPMVFIASALQGQQNQFWKDSLGRMAFVVGMVALAVFAHRTFHPGRGIFEQAIRAHRGGWLDRLRYIWHPGIVAVPAVFASMAVVGYYYTAMELMYRLLETLWLVLVLLLVYSLLVRWLFVIRRRLAMEQARQRREAPKAEAVRPDQATAEEKQQEPQASLFSLSRQTRELLRSLTVLALVIGLWLIWSDVLPALGFLDKVALWSQVTLADLGLAIIIAIITIIAAKNIPGLMEIALLQHLPLPFGVRFAITRVCRYVITIVGLVIALGVINVGWSKVQWLVAAITVGLGFGLQEIFANFVSGLIILFERPMRVGDTVTVGDVSGTVTKIRIRAATITTWDRKELIVPNKEFVTGRLINWSLSDPILRVDVPVGIAYGSDTHLAHRLLLKVAAENPAVLDDPKPMALFRGFGDNSLNFELRAYISGIENYLRTLHELHMAIDQEFRKANIEIAFPQRDLHLRTVSGPVPVTLRGEQAAKLPQESS